MYTVPPKIIQRQNNFRQSVQFQYHKIFNTRNPYLMLPRIRLFQQAGLNSVTNNLFNCKPPVIFLYTPQNLLYQCQVALNVRWRRSGDGRVPAGFGKPQKTLKVAGSWHFITLKLSCVQQANILNIIQKGYQFEHADKVTIVLQGMWKSEDQKPKRAHTSWEQEQHL